MILVAAPSVGATGSDCENRARGARRGWALSGGWLQGHSLRARGNQIKATAEAIRTSG